ncbi:hypothetical protein J2Z17_002340 [Rhizobium halophytocola]|uniref:Gene transfer agent family protein n=1 Tax=Rhizobium halophytocola TaxID=735519 RepID=A0ABS4DYY1_9HYPH|nr:hypothetical protein [Rhizobium halophytocola]
MGAAAQERRLACRANRRRGEVEGMIDGERRILCLTLGALAELETALGADSLGMLAARLSAGRLRAGDLIAILGAGLRGAGNAIADEDVAMLSLEGGVEGAARLVGDLLRVTFGAAGEGPGADGERGADQPGGFPASGVRRRGGGPGLVESEAGAAEVTGGAVGGTGGGAVAPGPCAPQR